ncbi:MAG TPA: carboxyltransferase domain-containing protein [Fimbriimonas sp.]|nr:carboxyltransferase domain-containing protein [Fimbriimonas sp.]
MKVDSLGESALIIRDLPEPPDRAAAKWSARFRNFRDVVPCYETVGIYFEGDPPSLSDLEEALQIEMPLQPRRELVIPVCYEMGEDLSEVSSRLSMEPGEVISAHSGQAYVCAAIGFCPGFPYLGKLSARIAGLPRKPTPRIRVEPGSVAMTGYQTGIYPLPKPGGWWIVGRTPLTLVDVATNYFPIRVGDSVRFEPIGEEQFLQRQGERL